MTLMDFRKPPYVVLEKCVSWSGKYKGFYGHHYHENILCYVVGTINQHNGEITTRHYNEKQPKTTNPKAECLTYWNELRRGLEKKPISQEHEERAFRPWEN